MGRRLGEGSFRRQNIWLAHRAEITLYAANVGGVQAEASVLRRRLEPAVSMRTWHRVFPYLPREVLADGALVLWHPDEHGWQLAQDQVHALTAPAWRRSGAYLTLPGSDRMVLRDFHDLDDVDLPDWSMAVPDAGFSDLVGRMGSAPWRLSELVARWALEVGPVRAGRALSLLHDDQPGASRH
jgi:hypothetical protein